MQRNHIGLMKNRRLKVTRNSLISNYERFMTFFQVEFIQCIQNLRLFTVAEKMAALEALKNAKKNTTATTSGKQLNVH